MCRWLLVLMGLAMTLQQSIGHTIQVIAAAVHGLFKELAQ
jgi:hypothetical protein